MNANLFSLFSFSDSAIIKDNIFKARQRLQVHRLNTKAPFTDNKRKICLLYRASFANKRWRSYTDIDAHKVERGWKRCFVTFQHVQRIMPDTQGILGGDYAFYGEPSIQSISVKKTMVKIVI